MKSFFVLVFFVSGVCLAYSSSGYSGGSSGSYSGGSSGSGSSSGGGGGCNRVKCALLFGGCSGVCLDEFTWSLCATCLGPLVDVCCPCLPARFQQYCQSMKSMESNTVSYCALNRTQLDLFGDYHNFEMVVASVNGEFDCASQGGIVADMENVTCQQFDYGSYDLHVVDDTCNSTAKVSTLNHDFVSFLTLHGGDGRPLTAVKFGVIGGCMGHQSGIDVMLEVGESVLVDLTGEGSRIGGIILTYHEGTTSECQIVLQTDDTASSANSCSQVCPDGSRCNVSCANARCSCLGGTGHQAWCSC